MTAPTVVTPVTHEDIGLRIKRWRKNCGWTQGDLSSRLNLSRTSISNIEAGRQSLSVVDALTICRLLGIGIDQLLGPETSAWSDVT